MCILMQNRLDQETQFRLLLEDPTAVSIQMLNDMLKLEMSTPDSPLPPPNSVLFYVRTFTIKVADLRNVLHAMLHDGYDMNEHIFVWLERIDEMSDIAYMTLRYCGQSKNRPWDRHVSDVYSTSLRSFLGQFLKTIGLICPSVLESARVQVVVHASATFGMPMGPNMQDLNEQVLIALFGDGVLNSEAGGHDTIALTQEDRDIFDALQTRTISALKLARPCSLVTQQELRRYARDVRAYVSRNPTTTKGQSKRHQFSDTTESMLVKQGTPLVLSNDSAAMVTLGSDLGDTHEEDDVPFFEAGGRSADLVTTMYNNFAHWENGLTAAFDDDTTKNLARKNALPFADLFPWFVKHKNDYMATGQFAVQYMNATKPYVLLTYGVLPTFAALRNFKPFSQAIYDRDYSALARASNADAYWLKEVMGVPKMVSFDGDSGSTVGKEVILIPCFHPGRAGYAGILKSLITRLINMVSGLAWAAIGHAVKVDQDSPTLSRKHKCEKILDLLNAQLDPTHPFGKALKQLRAEFAIAQIAGLQARHIRMSVVQIDKPPKGIMAKKASGNRRPRLAQAGPSNQVTEGLDDAFEVSVFEYPWDGVGGKDVRHSLTWTEDSGEVWNIGPLLLPDNVLALDVNDKRYVRFTAGGLDIVDGAGQSKGDRKPLLNDNTKAETLPIASLALTLCDQANAALFFAHWEDLTGLLINDVLGSKLAMKSDVSSAFKTANEGYLPVSFFSESSKRGLPLTKTKQIPRAKTKYLSLIKAQLPAQPGDLIWLISRFFQDALPNGGNIDLVPSSIHANSIYNLVSTFCSRAKYKNHPHLRTFLAFATMSEMGVEERLVPAIALTNVIEILFKSHEKKNKTVNAKIANEARSMTRVVLTVDGTFKKGVLADVEEPELEQDVVIEEDVTDDEGEEVQLSVQLAKGHKRQFSGAVEAGESSKSAGKALKTIDDGGYGNNDEEFVDEEDEMLM
jgi:hypothetical protein